MTPKPRSPMPIRVEIWDTKNRSGANRALVSDQAATRLDPSGFDHGYSHGVFGWPIRGFTVRGTLSAMATIAAVYLFWVILP